MIISTNNKMNKDLDNKDVNIKPINNDKQE